MVRQRAARARLTHLATRRAHRLPAGGPFAGRTIAVNQFRPAQISSSYELPPCVRMRLSSQLLTRGAGMSQFLQDLRNEIAAGQVVLFVGAGVSAAATNGDELAGWPGLLRSGAERASEVGEGIYPGWLDSVNLDITNGLEHNNIPSLLAAAEKVTAALGGRGGGEFKRWLRETVGTLEVVNPRILQALVGLGVPILTTNYDLLIESFTGRQPCTWQEPSQLQMVLRGESTDVAHMHGTWRSSESVILGAQSYGSIVGDQPAQALLHALGAMKSILFVGAGAGLSDPNLDGFRKWLHESLGETEPRHYRLCLDEEVKRLQTEHSNERVAIVPYGASFEDLVPFIETLTPPGAENALSLRAKLADAQTRAVEFIVERVAGEVILAEHLSEPASRPINELMIPPILLPVTQEQFSSSRGLEKDERPERSEPLIDLANHRCIVVVGEEKSGLTLSLQWLLSASVGVYAEASPAFVDFRALPNTIARPLEHQLRREFSMAGVLSERRDPIPRFFVAIDNVGPKPERIMERMLAELSEEHCEGCLLGVRPGDEPDIVARLREAGFDPAVRYLGRLNTGDITRLAKLVSPSRATTLAERAVGVLRREHLPRTPLTVSLLLSALMHEALLSTASETALLDAYVSLLLGRGDPHDDARFALDAHDRSAILSTIAKHFVLQGIGSAPEEEILTVMSSDFDAYGWDEDPIEVLSNFKRRNILAVRSRQVGFRQSSYLHLFAAKCAVSDSGFRQYLLSNPLTFSAIIRHYAALTRDDAEVLSMASALLRERIDPCAPLSGSFEEPELELSPLEATTLDQLVSRLDILALPDESPSSTSVDILDHIDDKDEDPFPLERAEDTTPIRQLMRLLTLVSGVLRDSELVRDLELKRDVLHRTLGVWGQFVQAMETDADFMDGMRGIASLASSAMEVGDDRREEFVKEFLSVTPGLMGLAGMSATLASRKLVRTLNELFDSEAFLQDTRAVVMGSMLSFDMQAPGWSLAFRRTFQRYPNVQIVRSILHRLSMIAYTYQYLDVDDEVNIRAILIDRVDETTKYRNEVERKNRREQIAQKLRSTRARHSASRLAPGESVLAAGTGENDEVVSEE